MVLLEQFLEEFNMFVRLQLVALLYHHYQAYLTCSFECKWLHCSTIAIGTQDKHSNVTLSEWNSASSTWSTINMVLLEQFLEEFNMFVRLQLVALFYHHYRAYLTCSFEWKWLHCPTITVGFQDSNLNIGGVVHNVAPNRHGHTYQSASSTWSTINMVLLERFLEEFNMFVQLQLVELLYHYYRAYLTCSFECKWLHCSTIAISTKDKHSNVTLSEWNLGLLDGPNRLHQVPGLQLEYWWSCAQRGSKPPWSHILECKQHMVNHQYGVVGAVPGGVQHVCLIAAGCTALPSLSECKQHMVNHQYGVVGAVPGGVQHVCSIAAGCSALPSLSVQHFNVTLSEWNLGLLDGPNRLHQVPGLQLEYWWSCAQRCSKLPWLHMLECKQHMVNHQYGVVGAVPGGVQHVCSIAAGCTALPSLSEQHFNITLSEWNLGLLDGLNRLHQVPGLQLEYWWSCAQRGSKLPWSHILECKQHMVNHQYGVVGAVPEGLQHVCLIAGGCKALASLSVKFHATSSCLTCMRHSNKNHHLNPQARMTNTSMSYFQSGI
ncbi:hypothetical protein DFH27DRAFT_528851 [Peziza echinospora]|nr:hypothetical protein DFH27DRAFT_528851 [Peziza echinospora]